MTGPEVHQRQNENTNKIGMIQGHFTQKCWSLFVHVVIYQTEGCCNGTKLFVLIVLLQTSLGSGRDEGVTVAHGYDK